MTTPHSQRRHRADLTAALAAASLIAGCGSLPPNVLVFGTTTVTALDVSPGTTGNFGVTLGYKRHEAVWMPLMAQAERPAGGQTGVGNSAAPTTATPAGATTDPAANTAARCPPGVCPTLFQGTPSTAASGATGNESYSVLATFSGGFGAGSTTTTTTPAASASADSGTAAAGTPVVNANVRQIFATGNAARLLAATSGPGLVSANATLPSPSSVAAATSGAAAVRVAEQDTVIAAVMKGVTRPDGTVDGERLTALLSNAQELSPRERSRISDAASGGSQSLRRILELDYDGRLSRGLAAALATPTKEKP